VPLDSLATRSHTSRDRWLDVDTYRPFGERVFLAADVPNARISANDLLTIFPATDIFRVPDKGMLELPQQAFHEFNELCARNLRRKEVLWNSWSIESPQRGRRHARRIDLIPVWDQARHDKDCFR
jgi:hypothetical protein